MKRLTEYFTPTQLGGFVKPLNGIVSMSVDQIWVWCLTADHLLKRHRSRLELKSLSDEQLKDIGLNRKDVQRELRKWFWQE